MWLGFWFSYVIHLCLCLSASCQFSSSSSRVCTTQTGLLILWNEILKMIPVLIVCSPVYRWCSFADALPVSGSKIVRKVLWWFPRVFFGRISIPSYNVIRSCVFFSYLSRLPLQYLLAWTLYHLWRCSTALRASPSVTSALRSAPALALHRYCYWRPDLLNHAIGARLSFLYQLTLCVSSVSHCPFLYDVAFRR